MLPSPLSRSNSQEIQQEVMDANALLAYYSRRAKEYERIYEKPERQADLQRLRIWLQDQLRGRHILEVACGTGYWTAWLAPVVLSIVATDDSLEVLAVAGQKKYPPGRVRFQRTDALSLHDLPGPFSGAFVGFWWSHLLREDRIRFLTSLHQSLEPGAVVAMIDNRYVEGSSTPIARADGAGNTFQRRTLADGSEHEILKNFPDPDELKTLLTPMTTHLTIQEFDYFWGMRYILGDT